ncbi:Gfo/Idh/MocA family protein [Kosmotoga pacifica]|uniref:Oxidoreductase n=1 Tax=Kosmotoga pacifica TaxID=1330330 RepID=A0A0G2ZD95_9BACT|nr:Gfo/Idh/MocA family oxidoreductase [Kosmotoga pacifica]AKI97529.1 hypothetical protein IX53_06535 [Kosmotoga pacifica]
MEKLRLAIVGCGVAARELHLPALKKLSNRIEITALVSRTMEKAKSLAELVEPRPHVFKSFNELVNSGIAEAVDLALPTSLNPEFIEKAVVNGLHVIAEKPIAVNVKEGKKVLELAKTNQNVIYIAENYRHFSIYRKAFKIINSGRIGIPALLIWRSIKLIDKNNKYAQTNWRQHPMHIVGFISDAGVHHIAAIRTMLGDVKEVIAYLKRVRDYLGAEDSITMNLLLKSGIVGNYIASYGLNFKDEIAVVGTEGNLRIGENTLKIETSRGIETLNFPKEDSFFKEFLDFYEVVKQGAENKLGSTLEALKDLAVIEAAVRSFHERRSVEVDELLE